MADFICHPDGQVEDVRTRFDFSRPPRRPASDPSQEPPHRHEFSGPNNWAARDPRDEPLPRLTLKQWGQLIGVVAVLAALYFGGQALYRWAFPDYLQLAAEAEKRRDYDEAIACYTTFISRRPDDPRGYAGRAYTYRSSKREYDLAIADYTEALRCSPDNSRLYHHRGLCFGDKDEYDRAIEDFTQAIQLDATHRVTYNARGFAYIRKKDYARAILDFDAAISLPRVKTTDFYQSFGDSYSVWSAYMNRADAHVGLKKYPRAIIDYELATAVFPEDSVTLSRLSRLLATCPDVRVRDGKRAVSVARQACEHSQWKFAEPMESLAAAHAECGEFAEAVKWQKKALEIGYEEKDLKDTAHRRLKLYENKQPDRGD